MHANHEEFLIEHLLRRASFGASTDELKHYKTLGFEASVEELTNPESVSNDALDDILNKQEFDFTDLGDLRRWWIYRMTFSKRPLEEKLALFWHGHFATANSKVGNAYLMYQQNQLFREQGLGDFQNILLKVSQDPAMILWLDNQQNHKNKPNENYAREVMELFTLGIGNYSETDVKEAARAFTGWMAPNGFYFNKKQHDFGEKNFLGQKGNLNGEEICKILANKEETAKFISRKLIVFFSHDDPEDATVERIADVYLSNNRNIRKVIVAILLDKSFRSEKAYHSKIKSPAELVVGTLKTLQVQKLDGDLPAVMSRMGQNLFDPPNVKGWDGGIGWIASDTLMERFNFAARISTQKFDTVDGYISPDKLAAKFNAKTAEEMVNRMLAVLIDGDIPKASRKKLLAYFATDMAGKQLTTAPNGQLLDIKMRGLIHLIMTLPSYQLA
jgi:uncharacterized protein (DUF1800 family)